MGRRCNYCEIDYENFHMICEECGESTDVVNTTTTNEESINENIRNLNNNNNNNNNNYNPQQLLGGDIFSFINADLRAAIEASIAQSSPSRAISTDYLKTMGKVKLDSRHSLLYECVLTIGPLRIYGTLSEFSPLPNNNNNNNNNNHLKFNQVILGDPIEGDTTKLNNANELTISNNNNNTNALILQRGKISFVQKALLAQKSGANLLIIIQSFSTWPFVCQDSTSELKESGIELTIPVICISQEDGVLVERIILESIARDNQSLSCGELKITKGNEDCSICMDDMKEGDTLLRLPCGKHVFHAACMEGWLKEHNTCPLCRHAMPEQQRSDNNRLRQRTTEAVNQMVG